MALLIPALALAACAAPRSAPADHPATAPGTGMAKVDIFGDSLAYQAAPYFNELVEASGQAKVTDFVFGGTATCDWLPDMRRVARDQPPRVVVMEFAGNTFTACMRSCVPESSSTIIRYCSAMSQAIGIFLAAGAHIYLEGTPIDYRQWIRHDPHWDDLNRAFAQLAGRYPGRVTYVDAGRAVEGSDQAFVWMLPCMAFEPCTGPGVGNDIVRSPDGEHFCPDRSGNAVGQVVTCDVYSSGAFRFASAMAGPVIRYLHLSRSVR
jgi:hypothetical protein